MLVVEERSEIRRRRFRRREPHHFTLCLHHPSRCHGPYWRLDGKHGRAAALQPLRAIRRANLDKRACVPPLRGIKAEARPREGTGLLGIWVQIFLGGNNGLRRAYATAAAKLSVNLHGAAQDCGPIIPVAGANRVFVTSQDGWVTALTALDGSLYWDRDLTGGVLTGTRLVAGVAYQPGIGDGNNGLIFAGTDDDTVPAANVFYGLNADNGSTAWTFDCTISPCTGGLGHCHDHTRRGYNP